jgi:hypothetical protein
VRVVRRSLFVVAIVVALLGALPARAVVPTTWSEPVNLDHPEERTYGVSVVMDGSGRALAVWLASTGTPTSIVRSSTRNPGGAWAERTDRTAPVEIPDPLAVAGNSAGDAVVAWTQWNGTHFTVHVVNVTADGAWGSPIEVSDPNEFAEIPRVAVDEAGGAVVAWYSATGVKVASYTVGAGWSPPETLSSDPQFAAVSASTSAGGDVDVVWSQENDNKVLAANRPAGGSWSAAATISTPGVAANAPSVTTRPDGSAIATWTEAGSVVTADRAASGTWSAPATLTSSFDGVASELLRTSASDRTVVVVLATVPGTGLTLRAASRDAAGAWTGFTDLGTPGVDLFDATLAMNAVGDALVGMSPRSADGTSRIFLQSQPVAGSWSAPQLVSGPSVYAGGVSAGLDDDGDAVAAWTTGGTVPGQVQAVTSPAPIAPPPAPRPIFRMPSFTG